MSEERIPLPGERYKHYKGGTYEIITMATETETQDKVVVYKSINFGSVYVRSLAIFNSPIDPKQKYTIKGKNNIRFKLIP